MTQSSILPTEFLEKLPFDIISKIFLYLSQQDCLNCMKTCRLWYDLIPQFTKANWETLYFDGESIDQMIERNLGKHVKHVYFKYHGGHGLFNMMKKLLDYECTEIESLEFTECVSGSTVVEQNAFLNQLRRLASHQLTNLKMNMHPTEFSILDLLCVCPHLTHFSFHPDVVEDYYNGDYEPIKVLSNDQSLYNSLIYLHVNTNLGVIQHQARSIIDRSPNLRYYIGSYYNGCGSDPRMSITPEFVLSRCPQLEYYAGDGSYGDSSDFIEDVFTPWSAISLSTKTLAHSSNSNDTKSSDNNNQQQSPFQYFCLGHGWNTNQITSVLRKYKDTLKHLKFFLPPEGGSFDYINIFETISMQHLRTLYCYSTHYSMPFIITLLNTCRYTIQEVQLQGDDDSYILDVSTLQALQTLLQLRTLVIKPITFADESSVVALLKRLPALENLTLKQNKSLTLPKEAGTLLKNIKHLTLTRDEAREEDETRLKDQIFFVSLAQSGCKLESVKLKSRNRDISFLVLDALANFPSLKSLNVNDIDWCFNGNFDEEKEEQHMLSFLNRLRFGPANSINNNVPVVPSTKIENLTLSSVTKLTYDMLYILSDFVNLQTLEIDLSRGQEENGNVSPELLDGGWLNVDLCGIMELLRKCKKLKKVVFQAVRAFGEHLPSYYLEKKLAEEQKDNFYLQKFVVEKDFEFELEFQFFNEHLKNRIEILNTHYL
ncbi:hypothetical protein BDC45DRAFT_526540 [Circinella umbellata]|nr:hypothetical protein BDC45DRAFT_526540 [Circinella umbellata]